MQRYHTNLPVFFFDNPLKRDNLKWKSILSNSRVLLVFVFLDFTVFLSAFFHFLSNFQRNIEKYCDIHNTSMFWYANAYRYDIDISTPLLYSAAHFTDRTYSYTRWSDQLETPYGWHSRHAFPISTYFSLKRATSYTQKIFHLFL